MLAMNSIVNIWLFSLDSGSTAAKPRAYVDDVSVAITAGDELTLRQQVIQFIFSNGIRSHCFYEQDWGRNSGWFNHGQVCCEALSFAWMGRPATPSSRHFGFTFEQGPQRERF